MLSVLEHRIFLRPYPPVSLLVKDTKVNGLHATLMVDEEIKKVLFLTDYEDEDLIEFIDDCVNMYLDEFKEEEDELT